MLGLNNASLLFYYIKMPVLQNLTAAIATLAATLHAATQPSPCYSDTGLVALHDKMFTIMETPSCYVADCPAHKKTRCIVGGASELNEVMLHKNISAFGLGPEDDIPVWTSTYFSDCRPAIRTWAKHEKSLLALFVDKLVKRYPLLWTIIDHTPDKTPLPNGIDKMSLKQLYNLLERAMAYNGLINRGDFDHDAMAAACSIETEAEALRKKTTQVAQTVKAAFSKRAVYLKEDIQKTIAYGTKMLSKYSEDTAPGGSGNTPL